MLSIINHTPLSLETYKPGDIKTATWHYAQSDIGDITIVRSDDYILGLGIGKIDPKILGIPILLQFAESPVSQYRGLPHKLKVSGTDFQISVWKELLNVTEPVSYKELASRIGRPKAHRAVANAVGANPISILIPCHKIIATNGIGGYRWGIEKKQMLLDLLS